MDPEKIEQLKRLFQIRDVFEILVFLGNNNVEVKDLSRSLIYKLYMMAIQDQKFYLGYNYIYKPLLKTSKEIKIQPLLTAILNSTSINSTQENVILLRQLNHLKGDQLQLAIQRLFDDKKYHADLLDDIASFDYTTQGVSIDFIVQLLNDLYEINKSEYNNYLPIFYMVYKNSDINGQIQQMYYQIERPNKNLVISKYLHIAKQLYRDMINMY